MVTTNQQTYEKEKREMEQNHQSQVVHVYIEVIIEPLRATKAFL